MKINKNGAQEAAAYMISVVAVLTVGFAVTAAQTVPADKSQLNSWFAQNVKPFGSRKGQLDPALVKAEESAITIKVKKDGSGNFKTVTEAINSVPAGNTKRVLIAIAGGVYNEKIKIDRSKPFITLVGPPNNMPTLTFNGDANKYGTVDSATLIVESDYFTAANIIIVNSSPRPDGKRKGAQAVALRISGEKAAFYNCKMIGFQDTLCDDAGLHLFKDCYIEGTVDFIFGRGTSLYLNTRLNVLGNGEFAVITAQARKDQSDKSVYSFAHCTITGTGGRLTYLGRAWFERARVIYSYTQMSSIINPEGWSNNKHPEYNNMLMFGEYQCFGPGADQSKRVPYSKKLTAAEVKPFISLDYFQSSKWLLFPPNPTF